MPAHSLFLSRLKPQQRRELEDRLLDRQNGVCFICEEKVDIELQRSALEIDHIVPIAAEGKDDENNFALVHESCNRRKSASHLEVARILWRFRRIEKEANEEPERAGQGANLGHVLKAFGGATEALHMIIEKGTVRYSIPDAGGAPITTLPVWNDPLSKMSYCFARVPIKYLHHDERINPRSIGTNVRGLIEEFYKGNPQLHVALAWWNPALGDEKIHIFDGQHKAAAQILLGSKELPLRIFLNADTNILLDANTNAGDKLRQVAFNVAVKRHLGNTIYNERLEEYRKLKGLLPDSLDFSEKDLVTLFRGERREMIRYILDSARDQITRDPENSLTDFIEWSGKGAQRPLSYATIEGTFYSQFLHMSPMDTPIGEGWEAGTNSRQIEREQMVRMMSLLAEVFFVGQWDPDVGGFKIEDRILKGEKVPLNHLRAWRIAREEILANILDWVKFAISSYFALNQEKVEPDQLMQKRFPELLWTNVEAVLRNIADLPCWYDTKLALTIFGAKQKKDFWKKILDTGKSPTGIPVLAKGLELKSLITPKGAH
jgi:hypothetical protein